MFRISVAKVRISFESTKLFAQKFGYLIEKQYFCTANPQQGYLLNPL